MLSACAACIEGGPMPLTGLCEARTSTFQACITLHLLGAVIVPGLQDALQR